MTVRVNSRKFDGTIARSWDCELISAAGSEIILLGQFVHDVSHEALGVIPAGTSSREYFDTERWFSIFRFQTPGGGLRNYYFNINLPPEFDGNTLDLVDLDLDLLLWPDGRIELLDEAEFERNASAYGYPPETVRKARETVNEVLEMIRRGALPI